MFKFKNKIINEILEWTICFIIAFIIYLLVTYFFGTISGVKQVSMFPTAKEGERLLIQSSKVFKKELNYYDIVIFQAPNNEKEEIKYGETIEGKKATAKYTKYTGIKKFFHEFVGLGKISYIKRVIGLPGDKIEITDDGKVLRNDEEIIENYLNDGTTNQNGDYINLIVPENTVYVMGDNRLQSKDSRSFGCIPLEKIEGYVITRVWPFNRLGKLDK